MNNHEFDDIIKQKAQQRETDVPADIWEGIKKEKRKRRFPFFWLILLVFVLGSGAVLWKMSLKKPVINTSRLEKRVEHKNLPGTKNEMDAGDTSVTISKVVQDNNGIGHSIEVDQTSKLNRKDIYQNDKHGVHAGIKKVFDKNVGGGTSYQSGKQTWIKLKKQVSKENREEEAKLFSPKKYRGNTKGRSTVIIAAGETATLNDVATIDKTTSADKNTNDQVLQADLQQSIVSEPMNKEIKTPTSEQQADSLVSTVDIKSKSAVNDSSVVKTISLSQMKKSQKKSKSSSLAIEGSIITVSPIQQYTKPSYVKRVGSTTAVRSEFIADNIKTKVEPGSGFEVHVLKNVNGKFSIGTGFGYLRFTELLQLNGIETHTNYTVIQTLVIENGNSFLKPDTINAVTKDKSTLNGRNIYNNFSVPVFMRYKFVTKKKWSCSVSAGFAIDLLRQYKNNIPGSFEIVYPNNQLSKNKENSIGFAVFAGLHFSGKLYRKCEWFAEPSFRYNFAPYKTNNLSFEKKIQMPGISFGMRYQLAK